jgi:hypothetical protein
MFAALITQCLLFLQCDDVELDRRLVVYACRTNAAICVCDVSPADAVACRDGVERSTRRVRIDRCSVARRARLLGVRVLLSANRYH